MRHAGYEITPEAGGYRITAGHVAGPVVDTLEAARALVDGWNEAREARKVRAVVTVQAIRRVRSAHGGTEAVADVDGADGRRFIITGALARSLRQGEALEVAGRILGDSSPAVLTRCRRC